MRIPNLAEIQKVAIITKEKDVIYIDSSTIEKINITEDIDSMGAIGEIIFFDKDNINESTPILGGEKLEITIIDSLKNIRNYSFIINQKPKIDIQDKTFYFHIHLSIIEEDYFNLLTKSYDEGIISYTDSVTDLIYKIFTKSLSTNTKKDKKLISKKIDVNIPLNLSFPIYFTLEECINYLIKYLATKNTNGYYFYKNRKINKYNLLSVSDLINNEINEYFNVDKFEDFNYILKLDIYNSLNVLDSINSSLIHTNSITADNKNIIINEINIDDYVKKHNLKSTQISEELKILANNNNTYLYTPIIFTGSKNSNTVSYENDIMYNIFTSGVCKAKIDGRFTLNIGDKINLDLKTPESVQDAKFYSGEWIIMKIDNEFQADGTYYQTLYLVKYNSLNKKKNPRIIGSLI